MGGERWGLWSLDIKNTEVEHSRANNIHVIKKKVQKRYKDYLKAVGFV